jgi:hypothetical protein
MRLGLEQALTWKGEPMMSLFVGLQQTGLQMRERLQVETGAEKATEFFVLEEGETRYGLTWAIYDLTFVELPVNLEDVVASALEVTASAGSPIAVFAFEGTFYLDYLTNDESARFTYAAQVAGVSLFALEDEIRASAAWAKELRSRKSLVLGLA